MPWPDIFFKAKKRPDGQEPPPLPNPPPEAPKIVDPPPATPAPTRPPPSGQSPRPAVEPLAVAALKASQSERATRTLPVMHGVVLRPLTRPAGKLTFSAPPQEPIKNIEQLMNEADPVKTLSQTGSVRMLKRVSPEAPVLSPPETPPPIRAETLPATPAPAPDVAVIAPPKAIEAPSPWPSFAAKDTPGTSEVKAAEPVPTTPVLKAEPIPPVELKTDVPTPADASPAAAEPAMPPLSQPRPAGRESTFLSRPASTGTTPPANRPPPPLPPMISIGSITRRKAKLADVARIVLPPKREETAPLPQPPTTAPGSAPAAGTSPVTAPSLSENAPDAPVSSATARLPIRSLPKLVLPHPFSAPVSDGPFMERERAEPAPEPVAAPDVAPIAPAAEIKPEVAAPPEEPKPVVPIIVPPAFSFVPKTDFEAPKLDPSLVFDPATIPAKTEPVPVEPVTATTPPAFAPVPQVDPEAHKTTPEVLPKLDPEAHKESPHAPGEANGGVTSTEIEPAPAPGTREFHLTNGERVAGVVLSETPDTLYVEHPSLGVLTVPRDEIATRLAEIILINGDRIVGNIMAETADMLYVRHASLGMLSVPKAQRSRRVVEAILKNGDRILGEVLTETDTFTVIKSATLGTVTVPHNKVNMLNRKIEQIEMKALPAAPQVLTHKE